ncbi:MAG: pseudouridine-5'-phosphate glycosidase [Anaerolineae bacterium]
MGALHITAEIARALEEKAPVVALESALITHGFAPPANLDIARKMEAAVRAEGAIPATLAILDGEARIGLSNKELEQLATDRTARKVSLRDLPILLAQDGGVVVGGCTNGGTTVAATMHLTHRAGIRVFCTGGIGGVHRGHPEDVSADLTALATTPIVTVCAGAKAILDLPRTLEVLETHGVPVIGYATDEFPAFYSRRSGLEVDTRAETPAQVAQIAQARTMLGLSAALLVCVPVPEADQLPAEEAEAAIAQAVAEAEEKGIGGRAVTPFLLARMVELTGGRARRANEALLLNNARTAACIARELCKK